MRTQLIELENKPVLATGFIIKNEKTPRNDYAFLMQYVDVFNYENKRLITAIDHTWLWCNKNAYFHLMNLSTMMEKFTLNDKMNFSAIVKKYRRNNGTYDWGLTLTSDFPVSVAQQQKMFKENKKNVKKLLRSKNYQEIWVHIQALLVYQIKIGNNIDDWRDISRFSKKDALTTVKASISQLKGVLVPLYSEEKINREIEKQILSIKKGLQERYNFLSFGDD